jgi:hypothetical protein
LLISAQKCYKSYDKIGIFSYLFCKLSMEKQLTDVIFTIYALYDIIKPIYAGKDKQGQRKKLLNKV